MIWNKNEWKIDSSYSAYSPAKILFSVYEYGGFFHFFLLGVGWVCGKGREGQKKFPSFLTW